MPIKFINNPTRKDKTEMWEFSLWNKNKTKLFQTKFPTSVQLTWFNIHTAMKNTHEDYPYLVHEQPRPEFYEYTKVFQ